MPIDRKDDRDGIRRGVPGIGLALGAAFEQQRRGEPPTPRQRRRLMIAVVLGLLVALAVVGVVFLG